MPVRDVRDVRGGTVARGGRVVRELEATEEQTQERHAQCAGERDLPIDRRERAIDVRRRVKEIAPAAREPPDRQPVRPRGGAHVLDRHAAFEDVMQVEIDVGEPQLAEDLERWQQRLALVRRRRGEHPRTDEAGTGGHQTSGNSSDFWYAEFTVSGMPQYLNSECRPT